MYIQVCNCCLVTSYSDPCNEIFVTLFTLQRNHTRISNHPHCTALRKVSWRIRNDFFQNFNLKEVRKLRAKYVASMTNDVRAVYSTNIQKCTLDSASIFVCYTRNNRIMKMGYGWRS